MIGVEELQWALIITQAIVAAYTLKRIYAAEKAAKQSYDNLSDWATHERSVTNRRVQGVEELSEANAEAHSEFRLRLERLEGSVEWEVKGTSANPVITAKNKKPAKKQIVVPRKPRKVKQ